jgi:hypothetical protein
VPSSQEPSNQEPSNQEPSNDVTFLSIKFQGILLVDAQPPNADKITVAITITNRNIFVFFITRSSYVTLLMRATSQNKPHSTNVFIPVFQAIQRAISRQSQYAVDCFYLRLGDKT